MVPEGWLHALAFPCFITKSTKSLYKGYISIDTYSCGYTKGTTRTTKESNEDDDEDDNTTQNI